MFVIDTNVASELMKPAPAPSVAAWIAARDATELFLTAVSEAELLYGIAIMPAGRRRRTLETAMSRWLDHGFADRILPFDSAAASAYAKIAADRRRAGRPIGEADCQIAAISRCRGAGLVTRDVRDFEGAGLHVVDPWTAGPDRALQAAEGGAFRGDGGLAAEHIGEEPAARVGEAVGVGLVNAG